MGHILSFKGTLYHGGQPITRGIRYIIAVFLHCPHPKTDLKNPSLILKKSSNSTGNRNENESKNKMKLTEVFHVKKKQKIFDASSSTSMFSLDDTSDTQFNFDFDVLIS